MAPKASPVARRRAQLSRESIVDAALTIAAEAEQVTFRALGTALNADPTAVYRHFRDKDELLRAVYDRLMYDVRAQIDESAPWRDQLRDLAARAWDASEQHPHIGRDAPVLTTGGPGELACIELMLQLLQEAGLTSKEVIRFYGVISSYILSVSANVSAQRLAANSRGTDVNEAWLYDVRSIDAEQYPAVAANRQELTDLSNDDVYPAGMEVLLDAVETAAAGHRTNGRSRRR